MLTNALTLITPSDIMTTARALIASGFLPRSIDTVDKAFAIITMSSGLGIDMWQGFNGINVIQGKPTVSPQLMLGLINRSGQIEDMVITATADAATITMKRRGRTPHTEVFSIKDAAAQGLTGKDNYKKQPAVMLKWRAVAACARVVFPDIIMGLYTTEELAPDNTTLTADGEATYAAPITVERPTEPVPVVQTPVKPAPATDKECRTVTVTAVRRVAIKSGAPIWGLVCHDDIGAEYLSSIASRTELGDAKDIGATWDTTIGNVTEVNFKATLEYEAESNYWWFAGVAS